MKILITVSDKVWGGKHAYMHALAVELEELRHEILVVAERHSEFSAEARRSNLRVEEVDDFIAIESRKALLGCEENYSFHAFVTSGRRDFSAVKGLFNPQAVSVLIRHSGFPLDDDLETRQSVESLDLLFATSDEQRYNQFEFLDRAESSPDVRVLPSGMRSSYFRELEEIDRAAVRRDLKLHDGERVVLVAARLSWEKQLDSALRTFAQASSIHHDVHLVIVGGGPEEESLRATATDLGVMDRVRFYGYRRDVSRFFKAADIFLFTSQAAETGPLALKEAMAAGLPVIADAVGGVSEFVRHEDNGILVYSDEERTGQLLRLLGDAELAESLGQEASRTARVEFRFEPRARVFARAIESAALLKRDDAEMLSELSWDGVRVRAEDFGGYLFVPRTSNLIEVGPEEFDLLANSVREDRPSLLSSGSAPSSLVSDLYAMGALVRAGAETFDHRERI
ncbi:glycosyltransferase [Rathayibacter agropyri]|uniref:glycosyltransferase n=1 Tax=Rathayibacter agropyri TaxID=1634927 RepID=UPI0015656920|nr:glycosyltransferase [Rathayibacter agropyri]